MEMERHLSDKANAIILYSKEEADRLHNGAIMPEHLMLGIIRDRNNRAMDLLSRLDADIQTLKESMEEYVTSTPEYDSRYVSFNDISATPDTVKILRISILEARMLKADPVDAEHILLALLRDGRSHASRALLNQKIDYKRAIDTLACKPDTRMGMGFTEEDDGDEPPVGGGISGQQSENDSKAKSSSRAGSRTPVLDNFSTDITGQAEKGLLDPVIGRETEIERLAQILSRRKKNNPVLIGDPGVGKSAIVEGLAGNPSTDYCAYTLQMHLIMICQ